ncbi:MAG: hypothetical protein FJY79_11510 [Candidatus Aminicenantes bacterium]|nr:hypothetical protein [Candidatus Aminicenantes bacterium]
MSDLEWLKDKERARRAKLAEDLRAAKEQAGLRGKEPFDFDRLRGLDDPASELAPSSELHDPQAVAEGLELRYYLDFPDVLTLSGFAEKLREMRPFR